jgi:hypothetical protein
MPGSMSLDLPSTIIFWAKGFNLTEKIQDEIGSGPNAVSAFYCIAPIFSGDVAWTRMLQKCLRLTSKRS